MLKDIRQSLREKGPATASMLARRLDTAPSAIQPMLDLLEARGHIRSLDTTCSASCAGCRDQCGGPERPKIYTNHGE